MPAMNVSFDGCRRNASRRRQGRGGRGPYPGRMTADHGKRIDTDGPYRGSPRLGRGGRGPYRGRMTANRGKRIDTDGPLRINIWPSAIEVDKPSQKIKITPRQNDLSLHSLAAAGSSGSESDTIMLVSNLHKQVSGADIRELFSEIGELKRYAIHYGKDGKPCGTAEVAFTKSGDAYSAMKRYDNVCLDGKPMKIEIRSAIPYTHTSTREEVIVEAGGVLARTRRVTTTSQGAKNSRGRKRQRGSKKDEGSGKGKGPAQKKTKKMSAEELDEELEKYHAEGKRKSVKRALLTEFSNH